MRDDRVRLLDIQEPIERIEPVPMDIIHPTVEVGLTTDEECPLIRLPRVDKPLSPAASVQTQCK